MNVLCIFEYDSSLSKMTQSISIKSYTGIYIYKRGHNSFHFSERIYILTSYTEQERNIQSSIHFMKAMSLDL